MTSKTTRARLEGIINAPMRDWDRRFNRLTESQRREIGDHYAALAERYTRAHAYVTARAHNHLHADAVQIQNKDANKVRKVLGFTYPSEITF